jgi:putative aldouronate transport system substrate-binding protein
MAIEQLAPKYAPKLYARQTESAIKQASVGGHLYGLPSLWPTFSAYGPVYRTDVVKGSNWNGKMENLADLEAYLAAVKATTPSIEPYFVSSAGSEMDDVFLYTNGIFPIKGATGDFLFIDPKQPNPKLFTYYEYNKTPEFLQMMLRWNNAGYYPKSGLADTDGEKVRNGKAAVRCHNIDTFESWSREHPEWEFKWANFVTDVSNMSWTQDTCVVASSSRNADRALDLYDLIMSDEQVYRAFVYGIEGTTYRIHNVSGQNQVEYIAPAVPELFDQSRMWCARTPEFYLPVFGSPPECAPLRRGFQAAIKEGVGAQKFRPFVPDFSSVEAENAACINAHMQYWWPLELAYVDINAGLREYEAAMKAAGIDRVRAVLQAQLDTYIRDYK